MNIQDFRGVWTALITPMSVDGVDYVGLENLVNRQIDAGITGLVSVGTTGESPTLDCDEHIEVIKKTIEYTAGRVPVIAGTGSNSTKEAVEMTVEADLAGADAFLIVAPYYNKPSQEGLFQHFSKIASATAKPIMLYSIPGRCGIEISNQTAIRLQKSFKNIRVIKEAGGKVQKVEDLYSQIGEDMDILSGDDGLTIDFMKAGAKGVVSVASNIIPEVMLELVNLCLVKDFAKAQKIQEKYKGLFSKLFIEPNPVPVKAAMNLMGKLDSSFVRLPLCDMESANLEILKDELKNLALI